VVNKGNIIEIKSNLTLIVGLICLELKEICTF